MRDFYKWQINSSPIFDIRYSIFDISAVGLTVYPLYVHVRERLVCIINHQSTLCTYQYAFGVLPVP